MSSSGLNSAALNPVTQIDIRLGTVESPIGVPVERLASLALRRNPKRAHLLTSLVLGKHVPTDPRIVHAAGTLLGILVEARLTDGTECDIRSLGALLDRALLTHEDEACAALETALSGAMAGRPVPAHRRLVLGYAETATGLGATVAQALSADYLHSTRRRVAGVGTLAGFEESHSHATSHLLTPLSPSFLDGSGPLVLVDDELTTGSTVLATIAELHQRNPRRRYVVACLTDMRSDADAAALDARAGTLGVGIQLVSLARGEVRIPSGSAARAQEIVSDQEHRAPTFGAPRAEVVRISPDWPPDVPEGGRHGISTPQQRRLNHVISLLAQQLQDELGLAGRRVLVLGTEEFMATPLALARELAAVISSESAGTVRFSTTTRSPVFACDAPGYPIRTALTFEPPESDSLASRRFAYNVAGLGVDDIIVVVDPPAAGDALSAPGGLLESLLPHADRVIVLVLGQTHPGTAERYGFGTPALQGPGFGSYPADDVTWLIKDLSGVELEAPTEDRERAIQAGVAHYAESLPQEYRPSPEYTQLFHDALSESAARLATAVGIVGEILVRERGEELVLASLARAGTPIGVLIRRWLAFAHHLEVPHYALSIVRARGIDAVALDYLATQHDPARVVFVDGWTGKGAIVRELTTAVESHNATHGTRFNPDLAVLADPGQCVRTFGTREDYLVPSACLNSTVSGLVSRTVLRDELIGPRDFHGAKFYRELAGQDVSNLFVERVAAQFPAVTNSVERQWRAVAAGDREPTWAGWAAVERISQDYRVGDVNFVKPGVGETTRVLLRRVPDRVLVRPDRLHHLGHVLLLAQQRGVPIVEVPDLPYACVGMIARSPGGDG